MDKFIDISYIMYNYLICQVLIFDFDEILLNFPLISVPKVLGFQIMSFLFKVIKQLSKLLSCWLTVVKSLVKKGKKEI